MVYVPAGEFPMGSTSAEMEDTIATCVANGSTETDCQQWYGDEGPQHALYLDAFWLDRTEVTNAMFARFVADTGYRTDAEDIGSSWMYNPSSGELEDTDGADWQHPYGPSTNLDGLDKHPVVHVSWNDAATYCQWAGKRLPTEAEWEKAARSTDKRIYPWGEGLDCNHANYWPCVGDTAQVASYPQGASAYGALDMAGNVWEWTGSLWEPYPYEREDGREDQESRGTRVQRGGGWYTVRWSVHAAVRDPVRPSDSSNSGGFRCARSGSEP